MRPILDLSTLNLFLKMDTFKIETPEKIRLSLQQEELVTSLDFSDAYSHSHKSQVKDVSKVLPKRSDLSVHSSTFWLSDSSFGVHKGCKGSETYGPGKGYKNPLVPGQLVSQSPLSGNLLTTYPDSLGPVPRAGLGSESDQLGANSSMTIHLCSLSFWSLSRPGKIHTGEVDHPKAENSDRQREQRLPGQAVYVPDNSPDGQREAGPVGASSHEASSVAPVKPLACARGLGECHPSAQVPPSSSRLVVRWVWDQALVVTFSGTWSLLQEVFDHLSAHTSSGSICHQIQQQTSQVCVSSTGSEGLEGWRIEPSLRGLDVYAFPPVLILGQVVSQGCPRLAKLGLVLGSGQPVGSSTSLAATAGEPADITFEQVSASVPTGIFSTWTIMLGPLRCKHPTTGFLSGSGHQVTRCKTDWRFPPVLISEEAPST